MSAQHIPLLLGQLLLVASLFSYLKRSCLPRDGSQIRWVHAELAPSTRKEMYCDIKNKKCLAHAIPADGCGILYISLNRLPSNGAPLFLEMLWTCLELWEPFQYPHKGAPILAIFAHSKMATILMIQNVRMPFSFSEKQKKTKHNPVMYCLFLSGPCYLSELISSDIEFVSQPVRLTSFLGGSLMLFPSLLPDAFSCPNLMPPGPCRWEPRAGISSPTHDLCNPHWLPQCDSVHDVRGENTLRVTGESYQKGMVMRCHGNGPN